MSERNGSRTAGSGAPPTEREPQAAPTEREPKSKRARATKREPQPKRAAATRREPTAPSGPRTRRQRVLLPELLRSRYRPEFDLDGGAQADVTVCRDLETDRQVVVKVYRHDITPEALEQAQALGVENPAHVVPSELGSHDGEVWEIQEYFPLGTLADLGSRRGGRLEPDVLTTVVREMRDALAFIHSRDLIHRDLKPQNVLLRSEDPIDCVLADFGLATEMLLSRDIRSVAGTFAYSSPESLNGRLHRALDWWALGVIVYELLVGRHPFADPTTGRLLADHQLRAHVYEGRFSLDPVTDDRWRLLLRGLLLHDYERRWGAAEVEEWLAGGSPAVAESRGRSTVTFAFDFQDVAYRDPVDLAGAFRGAWQEAGEVLAGARRATLERWLAETPVADEAARVLGAGMSVGATLVALTLVMDPASTPQFRGRELGDASLTEVAKLAMGGDEDAAGWIRALRQESALRGLSFVLVDDDELALAAGRLEKWWGEVTRAGKKLPPVPLARDPLEVALVRCEGLLLRAAFDPEAGDALGELARRVAAAGDPIPPWAGNFVAHLEGDRTVAHTALAVTVLPAIGAVERARIEAEEADERARVEAERAAERARADAERVARVRAANLAARRRAVRRLLIGLGYALVTTVASIFVFEERGEPVSLLDWFVRMWLPVAAVCAAAVLAVFLFERGDERVPSPTRNALSLIGLVTGVLLLVSLWLQSPLQIVYWVMPVLGLASGSLVGESVADLIGLTAPRAPAEAAATGRPARSRRVVRWLAPFALLGMFGGIAAAFEILASGNGHLIRSMTADGVPPLDVVVGWLAVLPTIDLSFLGGARLWVAAVAGALVFTVYVGQGELRRYGERATIIVTSSVVVLGVVMLCATAPLLYGGLILLAIGLFAAVVAYIPGLYIAFAMGDR